MKFFLLITAFLSSTLLRANEHDAKHNLFVEVVDETDAPLPYATVMIADREGHTTYKMTEQDGTTALYINSSNYLITVSYSGYHTQETKRDLKGGGKVKIKMKPKPLTVEDVVVTGKEVKGMTSTTIINRKAMEHLQPSSFSDILELLPGGMAKMPQMGKANFITLREGGTAGKDYSISSLGTSFVIDGLPISSAANLQTIRSGATANDERDITSRGVDMRTISTDNIESVEIIRGIPSVQYGDMTSGVVKIKRKEGVTPLTARFKADGLSKLVSAGKGIKIGNENFLNFSTDYLNSKVDPRDRYENYQRFSISTKFMSRRQFSNSRLEFRSSVDYGGSFDNKKSDPDIDEANDQFSSAYNRLAIGNTLKYLNEKEGLLRWLELKTSFSAQFDKLSQTRDIYLNLPTFVPNSSVEGEHDGVFLPNTYASDLTIDGKPLNGYVALNGRLAVRNHSINFGAEYTIDKNLGKGQLYDASRPPSKSMRGRPRAYNEIPAIQKISLYAEEDFSLNLARHNVRFVAGVRASTMIGMESRYLLNGKFYFEPRANVNWRLPQLMLWNTPLEIDFGGGYGVHIKTPTLDHLYPEKNYYDYESMNYFHNNADYRRLILTTFIVDPTNYSLAPSRNNKWEVRMNIALANNNLSVTYFQEQCNDGFRDVTDYRSMSYRNYDTSSIDHDAINAKPDPTTLPYTNETSLTTFSRTGNGSAINKKGVEFQFTSARIPVINTRVTVNGAWFYTTYNNSCDMIYGSNVMLDGKQIPYLGVYETKEGSVKEQLNANIMLDTYIPKLNLTFSTSLQTMFYTNNTTLPKNRMPYAYIDTNGTKRPYTEEHAKDAVLQWLVMKESTVTNRRVPIATIVNFKANKQFGEKFNISLFVNGLLDYTPDYEVNGSTIKRTISPYFGMELTIKL